MEAAVELRRRRQPVPMAFFDSDDTIAHDFPCHEGRRLSAYVTRRNGSDLSGQFYDTVYFERFDFLDD